MRLRDGAMAARLKKPEPFDLPYNSAKNLLERCTSLEHYNFACECGSEEFADDGPLDRHLIYGAVRHNTNSVYPSRECFFKEIKELEVFDEIGDCDGSQDGGNLSLIRDVYDKLWGWTQNISKLYGRLIDTEFNGIFGADTMNSAQKTLNKVLKLMITEESHPSLFQKKRGSFSLNYLTDICQCEDTRKEAVGVIESINGLTEFLDAYHSIGNFCLVPRGFNGARTNIDNDYWDAALQYLKDTGWGLDFNHKGTNKADFYRYINFFFLWDYVDTNGNAISLLNRGETTVEDYEAFFKTIVQRIYRRGSFMAMLLKLERHLGEDQYSKLRNSIFSNDNTLIDGLAGACLEVERYLENEHLYSTEMRKLIKAELKKIAGQRKIFGGA